MKKLISLFTLLFALLPLHAQRLQTFRIATDLILTVAPNERLYQSYLGDKLLPVRAQGLDPARQYKVEEINLMPGAKSSLPGNGETFSGDYLMKVGLSPFTTVQTNSRVVELTAQ